MTESKNLKNSHTSACILCSINCGIEINVVDGALKNIKGDSENPKSNGYLCQKAGRLDYYQNHKGRLLHPMQKKEDGSFEDITWDKAIGDIARKLKHIKKTYGSHAIAFYGGGGQGNHLNQAYSSSFRAALGTPYLYTALAQEKTGDFWVNGKLFGKQSCHISEDIEHSDYVLFIGTNPWQSHGFPQARKVLRELAKDPDRTMVVIDPRRTQTAALADIHVPVKPGTDAYLLAALVAIILQEGLEDSTFINRHTVGFEEVKRVFKNIPIKKYVAKAGLSLPLAQKVARGFANAKRASVRVDLGIQQNLHSTLNSYLEKLLFLITGNFGKKGSNNLHTQFVPIVGHSKAPEEGGIVTRVTGMHAISNFYPPNILPKEIDTNHPERIRALVVDSSDPLLTAADTNAYRKAFEKLELLVVIDVAHTETASMAHYVLPAASQFEKWEATFFTLEFPVNHFHLRHPIVDPKGDTLAEPEIYRRLLVAMDMIPNRFPLLEKIAKFHLRYPAAGVFLIALKVALAISPKYAKSLLIILYATVGKALPRGAGSAALLWGASHQYAKRYRKAVLRTGLKGKGFRLGEALFKHILKSKSGIILSKHTYDEVWQLIQHPHQKIHLEIPEMAKMLEQLKENENELVTDEFPFILAAGERRAYNANQIFRDPAWRKKDREGVLKIHPEDAKKIGISNTEQLWCTSAKASVKVYIEIDDAMPRGFVSLPHGYGFEYIDDENTQMRKQNGPKINVLTSASHCDPIAKTPYHKYVPVNLVPLK